MSEEKNSRAELPEEEPAKTDLPEEEIVAVKSIVFETDGSPETSEEEAPAAEKKNLSYFLRLALTLLAITALAALMLGGVNALTEDRIAENAARDRAAAMAEVLPGYTAAGDSVEIGDANVTMLTKDGSPAWCVSVAPKGFGGPISMVISVLQDADGTLRVGKVSVVSHAETMGDPSAESFLGQYAGRTAGITLGGENGVDAMTGATISSTAVTLGVNTALDAVAQALDAGIFNGTESGVNAR